MTLKAAVQHTGGVDRRQTQAVDGKLQNQELEYQGHMDIVGDLDKGEPFGIHRILREGQPQRRTEQRRRNISILDSLR